ncbi:hypothetical protein [Salinispora cortesiana]|uniref:hypothetical protein n=1 Tax=Salinispora cortesiana TaxID=1305843 RepID=UPI00041A2606|nr:hypothetical protein [Salinispora cortesiana]
MSNGHLSERAVDEAPEPVNLTDEPIRLDGADPALEPRQAGVRARRRRVAWLLATAVGLAGAGALGTVAWPIFQQQDTTVASPAQLAGLTRDDSEPARSTADYLRNGFAANIELDQSFGTVYRNPTGERRPVLVFGGTTLLWQPERDLDSLFGLMTDETGQVSGLQSLPPGPLGGVLKCGTTNGVGGEFAVCGWADHGSVVMGLFPDHPAVEAGDLFRKMRNEMQTR